MKRVISLLFTCLATTMAAWAAGQVSFNTGNNYCKVASAEYDSANVVLVQNIAEFLAQPNGTPVQFANPVYATLQHGDYLWFKDETGALLCRGQVGLRYYSHCIIPAGFGGIATTDGCVPQLTQPTGFKSYTGTSYFKPEEVTASQFGPDLISHWVVVNHVQLTRLSDSVYQLTDDSGAQCQVNYGILNTGNLPKDENAYYNIQGIVYAHLDDSGECIYELLPEHVTIDYLVITPYQVGPETVGKYVVIKQAMDYYPMYGTIEDLEGETCKAYLDFVPILPAVLCWCYDVYGQVEYRNDWDAYGYWLRETGVGIHADHNDTADVKRIKTLYKLNTGIKYHEYFDLTGRFVAPLTAIYQNRDIMYVRDIDGEFGMFDGEVSGTFNNGDLILGAKAKPSNNGDYTRMIVSDEQSFTHADHTQQVYPHALSIKYVNNSMIHYYLRFHNVALSPNNANGVISDNTGSLQLYNKFDIAIKEAGGDVYPNIVDESLIIVINNIVDRILTGPTTGNDDTYTVTGFLSRNNGKLVLYPVEIVRHRNNNDAYMDVNEDGEINIADVNCVIRILLEEQGY